LENTGPNCIDKENNMKNVRETRREYSRMDNPGTQVTLGKKQIMKTNKTKNTEKKR
jgi:hypothetical protein